MENSRGASVAGADDAQATLPNDPSQEIFPVARPEPAPSAGVPVEVEADRQSRMDDTLTLSGRVTIHYRDYVIRADQVVYHQSTSEVEADGHVQVTGGPYDIALSASRGQMRLDAHTARFFNVTGSMGIRRAGRTSVYSTINPMLFSGRVLLENGEGNYRVIDGSITNCHLPKPDWLLISHSIDMVNGNASMTNTFFKFLGMPIFYLPYLRHPVSETGRESGFMIPVISNSTIRGLTLGEQFYWAISRDMDITIGAEYYSKRGWAPNGDLRYRGRGLDYFNVRWNALLDRGAPQTETTASTTTAGETNQGGVDITASGRKDLSPNTRLAGDIEYLSSYIYRLVFNDNYTQATNSEVQSTVSLTHNHNGLVSSGYMARYQTFAGTGEGEELRILHLPGLRFDAVDRPLGGSALMWGMGSSLNYLGRSEYDFHVRNLGRFDFYPHLSLPLHAAGWTVEPEAAIRDTFYTISQNVTRSVLPVISHDPLNRMDFEASVDIRPPVVERDFILGRWNTRLRHTIEPELTYRFVNGIARQARQVILIDTADIATNTNEVGYSLTQRFYRSALEPKPCSEEQAARPGGCPPESREWASWQVAQKFFLDPRFGRALIPNRRNVFDTTLDLTGVAFLTSPRNISPVVSRLRFEAVNNLRLEWDLDYDPNAGRVGASNVFAGYERGRTTIGLGHSILNAIDPNTPDAKPVDTQNSNVLQSRQLQPFLYIGNPAGRGFNLAANGGFDFTNQALQYAGVQAIYNWNCCGLSLGYRRYALGSLGSVTRDETQWLYSFTLANFGSVGDIRRSNSVFRDTSLPPEY